MNQAPRVKRIIVIYEFDDDSFDVSDTVLGGGEMHRATHLDIDGAWEFVDDALYPPSK